MGWGLSEGSAAGFPGAVRETVITVNHEINNPLTTILGAAQVLLAFPEGGAERPHAGPVEDDRSGVERVGSYF